MINILIPLAGKNTFETNATNVFPKILSDIGGELLIERAAKPFTKLEINKKIVVSVPSLEVEKYKLDNVIPLLSDSVELCIINGNTQGAACSALLSIEHLDLDAPLIISSFEQVLDFDLCPYINEFLCSGVDAGVLTFEAIHPKWSYVKVDSQGMVTQAAEKRPISKNAIAGMFFYKNAQLFVDAAKDMIRKDVKTNDLFFISPTLNEIILNKGIVKAIPINKKNYFHINDEHALISYEDKISSERNSYVNDITNKTMSYAEAFHNMNIDSVKTFFSNDFSLRDPSVSLSGKEQACEYIKNIFNSVDTLTFKVKDIIATHNQSIIEFTLDIDDKTFFGVDLIRWNDDFQMVSMDAYLYESKNG
uniref:Glycosyltransferase n=1 Tax=Aeromonas hydrophila TaxID=644 RepID=A0A346AC98_AERHY|nr:glycosyltransferase [Aeromonas hydrophila]